MKPFSIEEYLKNPSRKVVTRDGRKVRIICTDAKQSNPIIALVELPNHYEAVILYSKIGEFWTNGTPHPNDLFFATEKHEGWINLYKSGNGWSLGANIWQTEAGAKKWAGAPDYTVTIKIEWEE